MKIIDGSLGEGGGQIFRTSLSLSMCTSTPVKIINIRAGRKKSGLLRQHLACLRASKEICGATVRGDELGSQTVEFLPGIISHGKYSFAIGSAGSTSLLFQTILPALLCADDSSEVTLEGGTHNQSAPSYEFISKCFIPVLRSMNLTIEAHLERYGFYPNGGGLWTVIIHPMNNVKPLKLLQRGEAVSHKATALSAKIPTHVGERELQFIQKKCLWENNDLENKVVDSYGPGNLLSLQLTYQNITKIFDSVGQIGLSAERVADRCVRDMRRYTKINAAVDEYLCDQLLLPLVLGNGGTFRTLRPSLHTETNIAVIQQLTGCSIKVSEIGNDLFEIEVVKYNFY